MSTSPDPVSLSRITSAFDDTIERLNALQDLDDDERGERDRIVDLLEHLSSVLTLAVPCGLDSESFFPTFNASR